MTITAPPPYSTIGRYTVRRSLGEGGMGMVLEGVDEKLGRHAAIKLLHRQYANDKEMLARFFNELRAADLRRGIAPARRQGTVRVNARHDAWRGIYGCATAGLRRCAPTFCCYTQAALPA